MKPGTKLLCIDAKEHSIPINEGITYTVKTYRADGDRAWGDGANIYPKEPGVELRELPENFFLLSRFERVQDDA